MIIKLLLLTAATWLGWKLWQIWQSQNAVGRQKPQERFEPMAQCRVCGVHLPLAALSQDGRCGKCAE